MQTEIGAKTGGRRGFSLIEMLIALGVSGIVLAASGAMLLQAYSNEIVYREQNEAQRNARVALDTVISDLRDSRPSSLRTGANPPVESNPVFLRIRDDTLSLKNVRYWLSGTNLMREVYTDLDRVTRPRVVIARNLQRADGASPLVITRSGSVATVVVTATVGDDPNDPNDAYSTVTLTSDVTLRNYLQ